ncbi:gamma-glutamyl cyclotransferase [Devosia epidermidihirudinis]|uniref:glutathione-specific gamma-glutamylcyclotransferase n=1 Tax=Devosia epidermidihirudinis TaxID=1293439 RepID=A0A0F5Q4K3_9HYPH|nr:gamma-glutamylcyclotransferase [Devosia epidermidihirudinis]KKC35842.1 gamma-glutamyl cyclotransferase [Devosia epidermidihirudinis]
MMHTNTPITATHWVFGYGSLIWNPGFVHASAQQGLLKGAHRSLSIISHHHRGTEERPGLVFGLTRGGSCRGMAFEVAEADWESVRAYLQEREQVTMVYRDVMRPVHLADGRTVQALAFLVDERHEQFAGRLTLEQQLTMVRQGVGLSGRNIDYVLNTASHLKSLGIRDRQLQALADLLAAEDIAVA